LKLAIHLGKQTEIIFNNEKTLICLYMKTNQSRHSNPLLDWKNYGISQIL